MDRSKTYQIYTNKTIGKIPCVEIQLGKQKKKKYRDTSVFFSQAAFQTLEETIWDNYREYSSNSTVKIQVEEWVKIIKGFGELTELLKK